VGHVREERAARLLEDVLLGWLEEGELPTTGELQEAYTAAEQKHGDLTRSTLRQVTSPARWASASASRHNQVISSLEGDMDVILRSLVKITDLGIVTLGEWNSRAKSLDTRVRNLKARIESLILLKSDTAGFVSFVEDGFLSLENVSSDTTANVDTTTGEVTLNVDRSNAEGEFQGTQIDLSDAQLTWGLIETGNVKYAANPAGSSIKNLILDKTRRWGKEVSTKKPRKQVTSNKTNKASMGELKIKLGKVVSVSKVVLLTSDATAGDNSVISAQYSVDGYTWENVPSASFVQSGTGNFVWRFDSVELQWMKFVVSKSSPDSSDSFESTYDYGFDRIKLYSEVFQIGEDGNDLVGETITPVLGDADVSFGRASLEVCEEVPEGTSLRYFLRAYDGASYSSWVQVAPLSRSVDGVPSVVDFTSPNKLDSSDLTTTFDATLDTEALNILRVDGDTSLLYRFAGPNDAVANFYIGQSDTLLTDLVLLRNRGYADGKFPAATVDSNVGDIPCGWGLDGDSIYYCAFLVKRPRGLKFNLGHTQAVIDGRVVSGITRVKPGWHTFRTDRANWGSMSGTIPVSDVELKELDPLYPYNHKYLIEGYAYPAAWTGEKVYLGVDEYGQYKATRVGRHEFIGRGIDLSGYAVDVLSGPKTLVLLKFDSSRPNHENERVRLFYTRRFDSFEGIQMKAVLKTENVERTPVLSYYRVRVK
jgi:hypothetical protein